MVNIADGLVFQLMLQAFVKIIAKIVFAINCNHSANKNNCNKLVAKEKLSKVLQSWRSHNHGLVPGHGGDPLLLLHLLMLAGLLLAPLWLWYSSYVFHLNSHSVAALCKQVAVRGLLLKNTLPKKRKNLNISSSH